MGYMTSGGIQQLIQQSPIAAIKIVAICIACSTMHVMGHARSLARPALPQPSTAHTGHCAQERARLRSAAEAAVAERDVLGAQLVRRNDEIVLLQQKLRLQRATIAQGNAAYRCALSLWYTFLSLLAPPAGHT